MLMNYFYDLAKATTVSLRFHSCHIPSTSYALPQTSRPRPSPYLLHPSNQPTQPPPPPTPHPLLLLHPHLLLFLLRHLRPPHLRPRKPFPHIPSPSRMRHPSRPSRRTIPPTAVTAIMATRRLGISSTIPMASPTRMMMMMMMRAFWVEHSNVFVTLVISDDHGFLF